MTKPTGNILEKLAAHQLWLDSGRGGSMPVKFDGVDFSNYDLRSYRLDHAHLNGCKVDGAMFGSVRHTRFNGKCRGMNLTQADPTGAWFSRKIDFKFVRFDPLLMGEAEFEHDSFPNDILGNNPMGLKILLGPETTPGWPAIVGRNSKGYISALRKS